MISRFGILFFLIAIGFVAVIIKIFILQYTPERETWLKIAKSQTSTMIPIEPIRGDILDEQGNILASSMPEYYVYMDVRVEALHQNNSALFYEYVDSIAEGLSRIVGDVSPQEYRRRMVEMHKAKRSPKSDFKVVRRRVNFLEKRAIQELPLVKRGFYKSGFHFVESNRRIKPYGSLASRTIGSIYGENGEGISGLEKGFDTYLRGKPGMAQRQRVAGQMIDVPVERPQSGCDIVTTLDPNLMDICETALRKQLAITQADWGCCILMEVHSGEIKAISNLDRTRDSAYMEMANHAVVHVEPGSTFKTISLMAALDDGKIDLDDTIKVTRKPWTYGSLTHTDAHPMDTVLTVKSALAVSSNIAFAKIVTSSYKNASKFVAKLKQLGVCDSVYSEIPGAMMPLITVPDDQVTISKMAYGYSVELSPLQMLMFYNGIANNGRMISPFIVKEIRRDGHTVKRYSSSTIRSSMCSRSTLEDVKAALHDVVWDPLGTASRRSWSRKAQSEQVAIAGKTGTAQIRERGGYSGSHHRMTFVGYFPEDNPEYTCICVIHHPHNYGAYDAGINCGSAVREVAEKTMALAGVYQIKNGKPIFVRYDSK